jgi:hypothetical protein
MRLCTCKREFRFTTLLIERLLDPMAVAVAVIVVAGPSIGRAAITGFGGAAQLGWNANYGGWGEGASVSGTGDVNDVLRITSADDDNSNSYFFSTPQPLTAGGWTSSFTYRYTDGTAMPADGITLTLHNDPRGAWALGAGGGNLGYSGPFSSTPGNGIHGITNSESFHVNIFEGDFGGRVGIGRFVNAGGAASGGLYTSVSPVTLDSLNDLVDVSLSYDGVSTLTATLIQPSTGDMTSRTFAMPSAQQVLGGGNTFFVGFTGATGGLNSAQQISNFRFASVGAQVAPSLNILKFSDPVVGVNAVPGAGTTADSPFFEEARNSIDSAQPSKYLNFNTLCAGIMVTPSIGATIATELGLTSANDAPERDPASFEVWGTNNTNPNDTSPGLNPDEWQNFWTLIATGSVPAFTQRGQDQDFRFANNTAYLSYLVDFPTIADATEANSMQIADIQLSGRVPEPGALVLLAIGGAAALLVRRRQYIVLAVL